MGRFIVGDVQGCFGTLTRLVNRLRSEADLEEIWLAGDLVNRGPDSLSVLRWAAADGVRCVLGNHDLYLLALLAGVGPPKAHTLHAVLDAHDAGQLADWLRRRPLLIEEGADVMVHAGFHPNWTLSSARDLSRRIESCLQGPDWIDFLEGAFRGSMDPLVAALNCFTRIRMVDEDDTPHAGFSGPPEDAPAELLPWYERSRALGPDRTVYFGHWAALGHRRLVHAVSLDGGCVWGRDLVAVRAGTVDTFSEPAHPAEISVLR